MKVETYSINNFLCLVIFIFFVFIKSKISSFEVAIELVNINILKDINHKNKTLLLRIMDNPNKILSSISFINTMINFIMSSILTIKIISSINDKISCIIAFIIVFIISILILQLFGEFIPKRLAERNSEKTALRICKYIYIEYLLLYPFVYLIDIITAGFLKIFSDNNEEYIEMVTKEEIQSIVETSEEHGVINESEKEMINGVFSFDDKKVEKVMKARTEVFCINIEDPLEEYIDEMLNNRYTRIPVYDGEIDNIIGILYIKDFFIEAKKNGFNNVDIRKILREAYFIPEVNTVKEVFEELQKSKKQIAILIDEYGGFSGIVTIEDLIEEIMGEIEDEYDYHETGIKEIDKNTYLVEGVSLLEDINDKLNVEIKSEDLDTLSGYLINLIGGIPKQNERIIENDNITFIIDEVNEKRIEKVIIKLK